MANQSKLKAYVRYDGTGRVIAGGPILQRFKPAVGNWVEIDANECCQQTTTTTSTSSTTTTTTTARIYTIGEAALGGTIAYILQPGDPGYSAEVQHGLVAKTVLSLDAEATWGCADTLIPGADGTALGTGNQNTIDIMAGCPTAGIAARICGDLVEGGYNDWYLPSQDELNKLYLNRVAIGGFLSFYWSSTEIDAVNVLFQNFINGLTGSRPKGDSIFFRPVRSF
jgi:hypothetical protein